MKFYMALAMVVGGLVVNLGYSSGPDQVSATLVALLVSAIAMCVTYRNDV